MKKNNKKNIQLSNQNNSLTPVATYENPDIQKKQIYSENKGKAGIYRSTNFIIGKQYIGSPPPPPGGKGGGPLRGGLLRGWG
jgi:hypothetical protein